MAGPQRHLAQGRHHEDRAVEQPGEDRVQRRADGHPDHLASADLPGRVVACRQVDGKGDQQADDHEHKPQHKRGLIDREVEGSQRLRAEDKHDHGKDHQDHSQRDQDIGELVSHFYSPLC